MWFTAKRLISNDGLGISSNRQFVGVRLSVLVEMSSQKVHWWIERRGGKKENQQWRYEEIEKGQTIGYTETKGVERAK